jgi:hypothetical protein
LLASGSNRNAEHSLPLATNLKVTSVKELSVPFFNFWGEPQLDLDGNIYFHAAERVQ